MLSGQWMIEPVEIRESAVTIQIKKRSIVLALSAGLVLATGSRAGFSDEKPTSAMTRAASRVRAGNPKTVAPWARFSIGRRHHGYYVGGGAAFGGDQRDVRREGTWGWDYAPAWTRVQLRWWHGRRFQDGGGSYRSKGRTGVTRKGLGWFR